MITDKSHITFVFDIIPGMKQLQLEGMRRPFVSMLCCNTTWVNVSSELRLILLVSARCSRGEVFLHLVSLS